ncbi:lipase family protein [Gordonia zhaorongruii]|uniref:lipase family protein n=1 Tax=Gordonia zhaorongruii TaxID=2597659 RepID=UPI00117F45B7|nr:lipase family protein [Gordonia zhaorongruii]
MLPPRGRDGALGVIAVGTGVVLALRPFDSVPVLAVAIAVGLIVTGAAELIRTPRGAAALRVLGGTALVVSGAVLLVWPGLSILAVAVVTGVGLIVWGIAHLAEAARGDDAVTRVTDALVGLSAIALAVAALSWPGVTVFAAAFVCGLALIGFGLALGYRAVRGRRERERTAHRRLRLTAAVLAVCVTVPFAVLAIGLHRPAPAPDGFYSAPLDRDAAPGTLLRIEPFQRGVPPGAQAWRILYTTTRNVGEPALASALVVAPATLPAGPRPVVAWAHGTTGVTRGCAVSLLPDPFADTVTPGLPQVISNGGVMVATDYIGLGTPGPSPYVIGQGEARSVLDSVRAARHVPGLRLADETTVWGHSQGGHAALWSGILAPAYAPDVTVNGVAALAPAADLVGLANDLTTMTGGPLLASYVIDSYSRAYPDVKYDDYLKVQSRLPMRAMATRCLHEPAATVSVIESLLLGDDPYAQPPAQGPLGRRLTENTPSARLAVPVFIGQGAADPLINPQGQQKFAAAQCTAGTSVDFHMYPGLTHMSVVETESPAITDMLTWTRARLEGRPATDNCAAG